MKTQMRHFSLTAYVAAGIAAAIAVTAVAVVWAVPARSSADETGIPPVPGFNPWVDDAGFFHAPVWDDRNLSPEQKVADPTYDPRWNPFAECMEAAGEMVRDDPEAQFTQEDLDAVFDRLNEENPDRAANKRSDLNDDWEGFTASFMDCALEHLATSLPNAATPAPEGPTPTPEEGVTPVK